MIIRAYRNQDLPQIAKIYDKTRPDEFYWSPESVDFACWEKDAFIQRNYPLSKIIVCDVGSVAGFCGWKENHINWLFVQSEYRGKGFGRQLLKDALNRIDSTVTITVFKENRRAKQLYESLGFCDIHDAEVDYSGRILHLVKMQKKYFG